MTPIKDRITVLLADRLRDRPAGVENPDRKSNVGAVLFEIYYWQEISKLADERLKEAWKTATIDGLLKADDQYRAAGPGESVAAESAHFSVLLKVSKPRESIDKDAFIAEVAKKSKLSVATITALWEKNQKVGTASLSKKVLEV